MRLALLPAALLLAAEALPAGADATFDLGRRDLWRPGDVVTTTLREEQVREVRFPSREGGDAAVPPQRLKIVVVAAEKCLETDLDGNRSRWLVHYAAWAADNGATKDESLRGAFVDVSGRGKDRHWTLVASPQEPSKGARAWLDREFGPGRPDAEAIRRVWLPRVPVVPGDSWGADLGAFLETVTLGDRVDRTRATANARFVGVERGTGRIACEASLPLSSFPGGRGGKPIPWAKGGTMGVKGTVAVATEGRLVASTATWSSTLEGEAQADGRTVVVVVRAERSLETKTGGTMPDPPAPTPAPAPGAPERAPPAPDGGPGPAK